MKMKSFVSTILVAVAMLFCYVNVYASTQELSIYKENPVSPRYIAIMFTDNYLKKGTNGLLTCAGETMVQIGYVAGVKVELQKQSGSSWTTIKTWEDSASSCVYITNDWYVSSGTYRLMLTHTSKNSSGQVLETIYKYSVTVVVN